LGGEPGNGQGERVFDRGSSLLDSQISYDELVDAGALEFASEAHLRRWFGGKQTITVGHALEVRAHIARIFWAVMRDEVLPESILHQFAVDYAREYLARLEPVYVDFRTHRGLIAKQAWLDGQVSLGEVRIAEVKARAALATVTELDDEKASACAHIVCLALAHEGEIAQRYTFYAFLDRFGTRADKEWVMRHVRDSLARPPTGSWIGSGSLPASSGSA
jgi:hypothetical protein